MRLVKDLGFEVKLCAAELILLSLVGVDFITDLSQRREGLSCLSVVKAGDCLVWDLLGGTHEGLPLGRDRRAFLAARDEWLLSLGTCPAQEGLGGLIKLNGFGVLGLRCSPFLWHSVRQELTESLGSPSAPGSAGLDVFLQPNLVVVLAWTR